MSRNLAAIPEAEQDQPLISAGDKQDPEQGEKGASAASGQLTSTTAETHAVVEKEVKEPRTWRDKVFEFSLSTRGINLICLTVWILAGWIATTQFAWGDDKKRFTTIESLYWMAQILTTVGYGDMPKPKTSAGEAFVIIYVLAAAFVIGTFISSMVANVLDTVDSMDDNLTTFDVFGAMETTLSQTTVKKGFSHEFKEFAKATGRWILCVVIWATFFRFLDDREEGPLPWKDLIYMAIITLTTVGFGDVVAKTERTKFFAAVGMVVGVVCYASMLSNFTTWLLHGITVDKLDQHSLGKITTDKRQLQFFKERQDWYDRHVALKDTGSSIEPSVSRSEFMLYMLKDMAIVDDTLLDRLDKSFDQMDSNKSQFLDQKDLDEHQLRGHTHKKHRG